jgi:hypothetical protein
LYGFAYGFEIFAIFLFVAEGGRLFVHDVVGGLYFLHEMEVFGCCGAFDEVSSD